MLPEGNWITRAPTLKRKAIPARQGAGTRAATVCTSTPPPRRWAPAATMIGRCTPAAPSTARSSTTDADLGRRRHDRLARRRRGDHEPGADLPLLLRAVRARDDRICREESFHQRQGFDALLTMMMRRHRRAARDGAGRVDRWWWPAMMMFGPTGREPRTAPVDALGHQARVQRRPAPEVRRRRRAAGQVLGVTLP